MSCRHGHRAAGDGGVVLVLVALTMTALLVVTAIVIDIGYLRGAARADQTIADLTALAGAPQLERERFEEACQDMVQYLNSNAEDMPAIDAEDFCSDLNFTYCTDGPLDQAAPEVTSGRYTVSIRFPVPDAEIADDRVVGGSFIDDGEPCDRMRVVVTTVEPVFFGGVVGTSEQVVTRSATLRAGPGEVNKAPALWLLEPYGCVTLNVSGSGTSVVVGDLTHDPPIEGLISVDSSGETCSSNQFTVTSSGTLHALPATGPVPGEIRLFALPRWVTTCVAPACRESEVSGGNIKPRPISVASRATRAPVDWRWNCKAEYPDYTPNANLAGLDIAGCEDAGERDPYIDDLRAFVGTSGRPSGFQDYPRPSVPTDSCNVSGHVVLPIGNWRVACPGGVSISTNNSLTFEGGNVIFDGSVATTGAGKLRVNYNQPSGSSLSDSCLDTLCPTAHSEGAAYVYIRQGDLDIKDELTAKHTMVYLHNGVIKVSGGGQIFWTAPSEGPFTGLGTWAERPSSNYSVSGGGSVTMAGTFFTPFANAMAISGGGFWDVSNAQYVSQRLVVSGGAQLVMAPDPATAVTLPPREGSLIR